jgi:hypothetical protein
MQFSTIGELKVGWSLGERATLLKYGYQYLRTTPGARSRPLTRPHQSHGPYRFSFPGRSLVPLQLAGTHTSYACRPSTDVPIYGPTDISTTYIARIADPSRI